MCSLNVMVYCKGGWAVFAAILSSFFCLYLCFSSSQVDHRDKDPILQPHPMHSHVPLAANFLSSLYEHTWALSRQASTNTSQRRLLPVVAREDGRMFMETLICQDLAWHSLSTPWVPVVGQHPSSTLLYYLYPNTMRQSRANKKIPGQLPLELKRIGIFKDILLPPATGVLDSLSFSRQHDGRGTMSEVQETWARG